MKPKPAGIVRWTVFVAMISSVTWMVMTPWAAEPGVSKAAAALQGRHTAPKDAEIDKNASIDSLLEKGQESDWSTAKGVVLEGYVIQVEKDPDGDVHIVLASSAGESNTKRWVIAEVTPSWQSKAPGLSEASVRKLHGKKVRVTGWLYYDHETAPDPRGTLWEIHPVTSIAKLE